MAQAENALPEFIGNFILRGRFRCETGLHIGGSKEKMEIGGVDSPVVRDPQSNYPYVPGSSLKGKLRSLLEYGLGKVEADGEVSTDEKIVRLFGIGADRKDKKDKDNFIPALENIGPSRLIVRDAHATEETKKWWQGLDSELPFTEYKAENGINRITAAANPRFIERVPADSAFEFELIYTVFKMTNEKHEELANEDLDNLRMALLMLEHNFLGKSGTRGYGKVKFEFAEPIWLEKKTYQTDPATVKASTDALPATLRNIDKISWKIPQTTLKA